MLITCPACQFATDVDPDLPAVNLTCSRCGSTLSLLSASGDTVHGENQERGEFAALSGRSTLGRFQLVEVVGQGGFGMVFRARDPQLDREVALKIPRDSLFVDDADRRRFLREAQNTAQLKHPGIVPVFEVGEADGLPFIVMEFIEGQPLASSLRAARPPIGQAVDWARRLCDALDHAHAAGVIHRDLKPANVMLDRDGQLRILDFGLGKREQADGPQSLDGAVVGTYAYMSPEQAQGQTSRVDRRSEVYSLGVMLFEMLTGERPFRGDKLELLRQLIHEPPPAPRSLNAAIPRDLETIVLKCLEKEPARRYASARDVAEELARFQSGRPILARPIGPLRRAARWCRRNPWPVSTAAVIVLILSVALAIVTSALQATRRAQHQTLTQLTHARDVIDAWYTGSASLLPYYPDVQGELLRRAADEYERFSQAGHSDRGLEVERGRTLLRLAAVQRTLGERDAARQALQSAEQVFERLLRHSSADREARLGLWQSRAERLAIHEADAAAASVLREFDRAIDGLKQLAAEQPADAAATDALATALLNQGRILVRAGQFAKAESRLLAAAELFRADDAEFSLRKLSGQIAARNLLAAAYRELNRLEDADQQVRLAIASIVAIEATAETADPHPQILDARAECHLVLAGIQQQRGQTGESLRSLRAAVADHERLAASVPSLAIAEKTAVAQSNLGQALFEAGLCREAQPPLQAALDVLAPLAAHSDPPRWREQFAVCQDNLAQTLAALGQFGEARSAAEQAVSLLKELVEQQPTVSIFRHRLAAAESHLANILGAAGEVPQALAVSERSLVRAETLVQELPGDDAARNLQAFILRYRTHWLEAAGESAAADECHRQCRAAWEQLCNRGGSPLYQDHLARYLAVWSLDRHRDAPAALERATFATASVQSNGDFQSTLAAAHFLNGQPAECLAAMQAATDRRGFATGWDLLFQAAALRQLGKSEPADAALQQAREWIAENQPGDKDLARWLRKSTTASEESD